MEFNASGFSVEYLEKLYVSRSTSSAHDKSTSDRAPREEISNSSILLVSTGSLFCLFFCLTTLGALIA